MTILMIFTDLLNHRIMILMIFYDFDLKSGKREMLEII